MGGKAGTYKKNRLGRRKNPESKGRGRKLGAMRRPVPKSIRFGGNCSTSGRGFAKKMLRRGGGGGGGVDNREEGIIKDGKSGKRGVKRAKVRIDSGKGKGTR